MLDIKIIRENPDEVRRRLAQRGRGDESAVSRVLEFDTRRRALLAEVEALKAERNRVSKEIGQRKKNGVDCSELMNAMKQVGEQIAALGRECAEVEEAQRQALLAIPNLPDPNCPPGSDATANPVVSTWGTPATFSFPPLDHVALCEKWQGLDFPAAAKISGSGFYLLRGAAARLERALIQFLLDLHTQEHGYLEIAPPFLVREDCMIGTGQLPKFREDMYELPADGLFLVPTAEVPVTNLHREEILREEDLPIAYVAYTPCFRREAGSAGRDNRGMIRVHQFHKVELVKITTPDNSPAALQQIRRDAEVVLERLGLHYRTVELCAGDLGFGAQRCFDLEVWAPGLRTYLEVSSCSNFGDFQARRMNLRYKNREGKNQFCHTLNGSGTALARLWIAVVETYQQADGSIQVPSALIPYLGRQTLP